MALNISKGKGKNSHVELKKIYKKMSDDGATVSFLAPGSYTDKELMEHAKMGKLYYPIAKQARLV
jgi:hypothetical protein